MLDETVYRCISASCARSLPRRVNFCPYCGTAQHAGAADAARHASTGPAVVLQKPAVAAAAPAGQGESAAPPAQQGAAVAASVAPATGASPRPATGVRADVAPAFRAAAPAATPAAPAAAPMPARPPERAPVRLRWWLLALAALWLIWVREQPATKKIDARIDRAIALATECKAREAQSELIALRSMDATQEQLLRVQKALNDAASACARSHQRGRAWRGADAGGDAPGSASSFDKVGRLLADLVRRWDR